MAAMNGTVCVLFRTRLISRGINGPKNIIEMSALMTQVGKNRRPKAQHPKNEGPSKSLIDS